MNTASGSRTTLPAGLPAWLAPAHRLVSGCVQRLPVMPPSFVLAQALGRVLLPRLPGNARQALMGRSVQLRISDFGLRVRLQLTPSGFATAFGNPTDGTIGRVPPWLACT